MDRKYMHNSHAFLSALMQRLKDQYLQSWYNELSDSSKLYLYIKTTNYIMKLRHIQDA